MKIQFIEGGLTVSRSLPKGAGPDVAIKAALDVIGRIYSEEGVLKAYHELDPEALVFENDEDEGMM